MSIYLGVAGKECRYTPLRDLQVWINKDMFLKWYESDCTKIECKGGCCRGGAWVEGADKNLMYLLDVFKEALIYKDTNEKDRKYAIPMEILNKNGACSAYDWDLNKCILHIYCLENNLNWRKYKPIGCTMFPIRTYMTGRDRRYVNLRAAWRKVACVLNAKTFQECGRSLVQDKMIDIYNVFDMNKEEVMMNLLEAKDKNPDISASITETLLEMDKW